VRYLQKVNRRSSNGQKPESEEEGDTRGRVAFSSKMWFELEIRIKRSTPLTLMATVQTQQIREERW
jgi:hypothetical protein